MLLDDLSVGVSEVFSVTLTVNAVFRVEVSVSEHHQCKRRLISPPSAL